MPRYSSKMNEISEMNTKKLNKSKMKRTSDERAKEMVENSLDSTDEDINQKFVEQEINRQSVQFPSRRQSSPSFQKHMQERKNLSREVIRNDVVLESAKVVDISSDGRKSRRSKSASRPQHSRKWTIKQFTKKQYQLLLNLSPRTLSIIALSIIVIAYSIRSHFTDNEISLDDNNNSENAGVNISFIRQKFSTQDDSLWNAIVSGINLTISNQRPSSYIFLFESEGEKTAKELLAEVSKYAVFELTKSNNTAINFTEEVSQVLEDYGTVVSHLRDKLEKNGLMIIENFDNVPEKYAKAFHFLCDEDTVAVKKSAFFFTMKVDKFEKSTKSERAKIENTLRNKWPGIDEDEFYPLYTRVSGMIVKVRP